MQIICPLLWTCSGLGFLSSAPENSITPLCHILEEKTMLEVAVSSSYRFNGSCTHSVPKFLPANKPTELMEEKKKKKVRSSCWYAPFTPIRNTSSQIHWSRKNWLYLLLFPRVSLHFMFSIYLWFISHYWPLKCFAKDILLYLLHRDNHKSWGKLLWMKLD